MMTLYDVHWLIRWYLSTGPVRFHVLDVRILGSVCGNSEIVPGTPTPDLLLRGHSARARKPSWPSTVTDNQVGYCCCCGRTAPI